MARNGFLCAGTLLKDYSLTSHFPVNGVKALS